MANVNNSQVVILAGGKGLRMRDYSELIPKALVPIGPFPVILHVMNIFSSFGYGRFVLLLGYKGEMIKDFFMDLELRLNDFTMRIDAHKKEFKTHLSLDWANFEITFADTGQETQTGGRVKLAEKYVDSDDFFVSYCDGLSDINITKLHDFHKKNGKIGTMTAVHPMTTFGLVETGADNLVKSFREKPFLKDYINGGFFAFKKDFFDYLSPSDVLEETPMKKLVDAKELAAYKHEDFWACMDTTKDIERLNGLWNTEYMAHTGFKGKAPWANK